MRIGGLGLLTFNENEPVRGSNLRRAVFSLRLNATNPIRLAGVNGLVEDPEALTSGSSEFDDFSAALVDGALTCFEHHDTIALRFPTLGKYETYRREFSPQIEAHIPEQGDAEDEEGVIQEGQASHDIAMGMLEQLPYDCLLAISSADETVRVGFFADVSSSAPKVIRFTMEHDGKATDSALTAKMAAILKDGIDHPNLDGSFLKSCEERHLRRTS